MLQRVEGGVWKVRIQVIRIRKKEPFCAFSYIIWVVKCHMKVVTILRPRCHPTWPCSGTPILTMGSCCRLPLPMERWIVQASVAREAWVCPGLAFLSLLSRRAWIYLLPVALPYRACVLSAPIQHSSGLPVGHIEQSWLHFRNLPCPINFSSWLSINWKEHVSMIGLSSAESEVWLE
jgi:hypothetical protein